MAGNAQRFCYWQESVGLNYKLWMRGLAECSIAKRGQLFRFVSQCLEQRIISRCAIVVQCRFVTLAENFMHAPIYLEIIYWLPTPILAVLAGLFLKRRLYQEFPVFFSYIIVAILGDIPRFVTYRFSFPAYAKTFWITQLLNTVLAIAAIGDLFLKRVFSQFHKIRIYRYLFLIAAAVTVLLATITFLGSITNSVLLNVLQALDLTRVFVLCFFFALMLLFGLEWSQYEFGLALGFALDAAAFLGAFALRQLGLFHGFVTVLPVIAIDLACIVWLISFLHPKKADNPLPHNQPASDSSGPGNG